jgi:chemotaxis protein methyltransferase CheR
MAHLGLASVGEYRARLEAEPAEWSALESLCGVTLSRFYRDRGTWDALRDDVLPTLAQAAIEAKEEELRCWSIGCASGEEPYTLSIAWALGVAHRFPGLRLRVLGTDFDERVLRRAAAGIYSSATLRDLPPAWRERAFDRDGELFRLRDGFRGAVDLERADVRQRLPDGEFRGLFCRNLVFTYFDESLQRETLGRLLPKLVLGGAFLVGRHEDLPQDAALVPWHPALGIFRRPRGDEGRGVNP